MRACGNGWFCWLGRAAIPTALPQRKTWGNLRAHARGEYGWFCWSAAPVIQATPLPEKRWPIPHRRQPVCVVVGQAGTAPICRTPCGITLCIPKAACGWIGRGRPAGNLPPMRYLRAAVWISGLAFVTQPQRLDHGIGGGPETPGEACATGTRDFAHGLPVGPVGYGVPHDHRQADRPSRPRSR